MIFSGTQAFCLQLCLGAFLLTAQAGAGAFLLTIEAVFAHSGKVRLISN